MDIDFGALGLVAAVTIFASVLLVAIVALGARLLAAGEAGTANGPRRLAGWTMIGLAGLCVLYGLYLVIPYFHS